MSSWIMTFLLTAVTGIPADSVTLKVRHDHDPWGKCVGELTVTGQGVEYTPNNKEKHHRIWSWENIQTFDRKSPQQFGIFTYEDQAWKLGLDRFYDFTVLPDQEPLKEETFQLISRSLTKAVTDRIERQIAAVYQVSVKHLHTFGGCEGVLRFSEEWVVYETEYDRHARTWSRSRGMESVWSSDRFHLELHVFEPKQKTFEGTRRFRFQLKEPLDRAYYDKLRRELVVAW